MPNDLIGSVTSGALAAPVPDPAPLAQDVPDTTQPERDDLLDQVIGARRARLDASLRNAVRQTPDTHAEILALSTATRLPAELVARNLDTIRQKVRLSGIDQERIRKDHPELGTWLADPDNSAIGSDDVPGLENVHRAMRQLGAGPKDDPWAYSPRASASMRPGTSWSRRAMVWPRA
jgi:hypothetical protein